MHGFPKPSTLQDLESFAVYAAVFSKVRTDIFWHADGGCVDFLGSYGWEASQRYGLRV